MGDLRKAPDVVYMFGVSSEEVDTNPCCKSISLSTVDDLNT